MTHSPFDDFSSDSRDDFSDDELSGDEPRKRSDLSGELKEAWQRLVPGGNPLDEARDSGQDDATTLATLSWMRNAWSSLPTPTVEVIESAGKNVPEIEAARAAWRSQPIPDPLSATEKTTSREAAWLRTALRGAKTPDPTATATNPDTRTEQVVRWTAGAFRGVRTASATPRGRVIRLSDRILRRLTPVRAAAAILVAALTVGTIQSALQPENGGPAGPPTALQMRIAGDWTSFIVPGAPVQASMVPNIVFDLDIAAQFAGFTLGSSISGAATDDIIQPLRNAVGKRRYSEALNLGREVLNATRESPAIRSEVLAILATCARGLGQIDEAIRYQDALMTAFADLEADVGPIQTTATSVRASLRPIALERHNQLVRETGADAARIVWRDKKVSDWRRDGVAADARYNFEPGVVLALITGQLIADGELGLDDDIQTHLPSSARGSDPITYRHLLTHTSGLTLNRRGQLTRGSGPGAFHYDAASAFALYAVLQAVTDDQLSSYAARNVFGPIGAATARLDSDDGEPQLIASVADMTRVGKLILHRGRSGSRQLIASSWIERMIAPGHDRADHGFLVWLTDEPIGAAALGPLDNNLYVLPNHDLVVVRAQSKPFPDAVKSYEPEAQSLFGLFVDRG